MPATTADARRALPASLLLSKRHLKKYRKWQSTVQNLPSRHVGSLPSATEYSDFQAWLSEETTTIDSGYFSDGTFESPFADLAAHINPSKPGGAAKGDAQDSVATCGHAAHPAVRCPGGKCPVCTVECHIVYMDLLAQVLDREGGDTGVHLVSDSIHEWTFRAWYLGKLDLARDLGMIEDAAMQEQQEQNRHNLHGHHSSLQTAQLAAQKYWASVQYASNLSAKHNSNNRTAKKGVSFAEDTCFERGRHTTRFWRSSPRYEPGKYHSDKEFENTSSGTSPRENGKPGTENDTETFETFEDFAMYSQAMENGGMEGIDYGEDEWEDVGENEDDEESDGEYSDDEPMSDQVEDMEEDDVGFIEFG
ncbi:hypothetical protein BS50DRAFT_574190 [Corynespora cassiicola Philippines]|uniref:Uncharacterized protein n=1 Tax=Corynespora cassiicola Philippines TaxID=1448308 RepID=A0A2T2NQ05_CORCC|nr:hypothetical protein BS50DRAFT_574190 [Corynespora cassiicola Philippines]